MRKYLIALAVAATLTLGVVANASAATGTVTTSGSTTTVPGAWWQLDSNGTAPYGTVDWTPSSTVTINDLSGLSAYMKMIVGDCGGGAPRFQIHLTDGKNLFVYIGTQPNYDQCNGPAFNTGNLLAAGQTRVDATQEGGPYNDSWSDVQANIGSKQISTISYVLDGGWKAAQSVKLYDMILSFSDGSHAALAPPAPPVTPAVLAQVDRITACASKPVFRAGDGSYGIYVDLDQPTFQSGIYAGVSFTVSNYVQGVGTTCDIPAGYVAAGYKVDEMGVREATADGNIYPYYVKTALTQ